MAGSFAGKVALVTGGGSGIGRATAVMFAARGARVAVADINAAGGQETLNLIGKAGGQAVFIKVDVSRASEVEAMVARTVAEYGRLDCAFNNAGIFKRGPKADTTETSEEDWDSIMATNLKGVWLCLKYEIPQMLKQGGGAIVNTSSIAGLVGMEESMAYVVSKHGVVGLTRVAAVEYAHGGIRVNAVCPGFIGTSMIGVDSMSGAEAKAFQGMLNANMPLARLGAPEEIAEAVLWLSSDAASFVTGQALAVDGGWVTK